MNLPYAVSESLQSLTANPLRSALSILGVVFGVASVVAMLSIGLGAEAEIERLLDALGARNIHITADDLEESDWNRVLRATTGLSLRDVGVLQSLIAGAPAGRSGESASLAAAHGGTAATHAADHGGELAWVGAWRADDASLPLTGAKLDVFGVTPNLRQILGIKLLAGRAFTPREDALARPVCLLGEGLARSWFGEPTKALGETIRIDRSWLRVIGVLAGDSPAAATGATTSTSDAVDVEPGSPAPAPAADDGGKHPPRTDRHDAGTPVARPKAMETAATEGAGGGIRLLALQSAVVVPYTSAIQRLGPQGALAPLERVIVKLPESVDPIAMRGRIDRLLSRLHRHAQVVTVTAADEVIEQKRSTTRLFSYFLMTIALISLVVGGIGIANVMLASMVERIREVGLRRAIGAKRGHILWQFLTESLTVCLFGGLVGGFVGMGVSLLIGHVTGWNVAFPWWGHGVAVAIATLVGIVSGLYPAILASKISPIEALQGRA